MAAWKYEISPLALKNISPICCAHLCNIFQQSKRNFVSPSGHILYISLTKFSTVIGPLCAYLLQNCSAVTWVSNYSYAIFQLFPIG